MTSGKVSDITNNICDNVISLILVNYSSADVKAKAELGNKKTPRCVVTSRAADREQRISL
jgi:hypothetical protein